MKRVIVLIGQTPPPFHGQAIAIKNLLSIEYEKVKFHHVRMAFSESIAEVGGFKLKKIIEIFRVLLLALKARFTTGSTTLFYHPAGGDTVPIIRDWILLLILRPFYPTLILHYHADGMTERYQRSESAIFRWLCRRAYFGAKIGIKVSAGSTVDLDVLKTKHGLVIHNSVNPPEKISDPQPARKGNKIMFLGSVIETKGVKELIDALALVNKTHPDAEAHIVGAHTPEFGDELMAHAEKLGIADQVFLLGQKTGEDKGRVFAGSDIFCFPSFYPAETFGLVVAEAMSYRLPVVTTRWKGIPEVIEDGESGYLVEVHDQEDLAKRLCELLDDSALREKFGASGRARYEKYFALERLQERLEKGLSEGLKL